MNRRDFLKIAALGVMGILKPSFLDVNSETGAKMELSNLWVKIAKNQKLTPQEIDFLRLQGDEVQKRNAQVSKIFSNDGNLSVGEITAQKLIIGKEIYSGLAARYYKINTTCVNGYTDIPSWTVEYENYGFRTDGKYIYIPETGTYQVIIHNHWEENIDGAREVYTNINDGIHNAPRGTTLASILSFTYITAIDEKDYNSGDKISMTVGQTSGIDLDLMTAWISIRKIR